MTSQSLCEIWEQYPYGPSGQKISPRLVLFKQNQRNHDPYTSELQKAYKTDNLVNRHNMMSTVSKLYVSNKTWIYVYMQEKLDKISTPIPTPTPESFNSNSNFNSGSFNSNSNSNPGSFNSNSNSGKSLEYQLQLRRFQLQFQLRSWSWSWSWTQLQLQLRSWPQPWSWITSPLFNVNRYFHSWDTAISNLILKIHGQGHVCGSKVLTLKIEDQCHGAKEKPDRTLGALSMLSSIDMLAFRFLVQIPYFDLEKPRSRSWPRSGPLVTFKA